MILGLFVVLLALAVILIVIGLVKPTESAQALVGFFFFFLLSLIIINGNLEYETGINTTVTINYDVNGSIDSTDQTLVYTYANFDDTTSRRIGYYLAVASVIGFAGVLWSLRKTNRGEE